MQPLPPGGGQGEYAGQFTDEADTEVLGTFELEIDDVGAVSGSGLLSEREINITGVLNADEVDAYIDDAITHRSGRFRGRRSGSGGYTGEFWIDREEGTGDLEGYWNCSPSS